MSVYEHVPTGGKINISRRVLFGKRGDITLPNLHKATTAITGHYKESRFHLTNGKTLHAIYLGILDGVKIGRYLSQITEHDLIKNDLTWHKEDCCPHKTKIQNVIDNGPLHRFRKNQAPVVENTQYLISLDDKNKKIGQLTIHGDWCYGFRLVDKYTKLSFAYILGDALLSETNHIAISSDNLSQLNQNPLSAPIRKFVTNTDIIDEINTIRNFIPDEAMTSVIIMDHAAQTVTMSANHPVVASVRKRPRAPRPQHVSAQTNTSRRSRHPPPASTIPLTRIREERPVTYPRSQGPERSAY